MQPTNIEDPGGFDMAVITICYRHDVPMDQQ
jgi:hypothetical protein